MDDPRHGDKETNGTELSGKAGAFEGKIRGFRIADLVLAVVVIWALAVKPYIDGERERARDEATAKEHAKIADAQEKMAVAFTELSFIITIPPEQRGALNLAMPQSLRDKLYHDPRRMR